MIPKWIRSITVMLALLFALYPDHRALSGVNPEKGMVLSRNISIDIAVETIEADPLEVARGEKVTFRVTLKNKGGEIKNPVTVRAISGKKVLAERVLSRYEWDVNSLMVIDLTWDTSGFEIGSYPVRIEAPLFGDTHAFDNRMDLQGEIIIR